MQVEMYASVDRGASRRSATARFRRRLGPMAGLCVAAVFTVSADHKGGLTALAGNGKEMCVYTGGGDGLLLQVGLEAFNGLRLVQALSQFVGRLLLHAIECSKQFAGAVGTAGLAR